MQGYAGEMASLDSVAAAHQAAAKAASLQRAGVTRRRLLREAAELGGVLDGDVRDLVLAWKGSYGVGLSASLITFRC